jgi:ankyrin repeat protein
MIGGGGAEASGSSDPHGRLASFQWSKQLYARHNGQDGQGWTDLDLALQAGQHDQAKALLDGELNGRENGYDTRAAWLDAVRHNRLDILRGLLILGSPDELKELSRRTPYDEPIYQSPLQQALALKDAGLSAVIKQFPYQSPRREKVDLLNVAAWFRDAASKIACRHLSMYQQEQQAKNPQIKFQYEKFRSVEEIAKNVTYDTEQKFQALKTQATEIHVVGNAKFGQFLVSQFVEMDRNKKSSKLMLVKSVNHVMNLGLLIKNKDGKKSFAVKFYDPNYTTNGVRSKSASPQAFEAQTMGSYVLSGDMGDYYSQAYLAAEYVVSELLEQGWGGKEIDAYEEKDKGASMIFVRPEEDGQASSVIPSNSGAARMLTTCVDVEEMEPDAITLMMEEGFAADLGRLQPHLATLSEEQQIRLLGTVDSFGHLPLYAAMEKEQTEAIKVYGELLAAIPKARRFELLAAKDSDTEFTALFESMNTGKHKAIRAYGEVLASLFSEHNESQPGKRQRRDAGTDFKPADQQLIDLITGINSRADETALHAAMNGGHGAAVKEYGELLELLPPDKQCELLLARNWDKKSAPQTALENHHFDTAMQYLDIVEKFAPGFSPDDLASLLAELKRCLSGGTFPSNPLLLKHYSKMKKKIEKKFSD